MKINPVNKFFNKAGNFVPIAMMWGVSTVVLGDTTPSFIKYVYDQEEQAKKEIQLKDPQRYERISAQTESINIFKRDDFAWRKEAGEMNDSLRMDSIIQRAYFEGAQMVRDSIANANKK